MSSFLESSTTPLMYLNFHFRFNTLETEMNLREKKELCFYAKLNPVQKVSIFIGWR